MAGTEHLTTDILIIGGGSAGSMAAIRAKELAPDLHVTVFEKGDLRRGGTIAMGMDALNNVVVPGVATEEDYLEAMNLVTEGIYDPEPQRVIARRSYPMLQKLEAWGIRFRRNPDGTLVVAHCHPNARFMVPMDAPDIKLVLLDATAKKATFLHHIKDKLELRNVEIVVGRAEAVAHLAEYREQFDVVLSRGVAPLVTLVELTLPFCAIGGRSIAQKKGEIGEEIESARSAITQLGGRLREVRRVELTEFTDERYLVVIDKVGPTPEKYPRRPGMPAKRPLG